MHPILTRTPPPWDHRIRYGPGPRHFADLRLPAGSDRHPVAVVVHGGFWRSEYDLEHLGHLCAGLTEIGFATWNVEYRCVGDVEGGWPNALIDVRSAVHHLGSEARRHPLDLDRIVLVGFSAGGQLVSCMASDDPTTHEGPHARGVVVLAGVMDLRAAASLALGDGAVTAFLGGSPSEVSERYVAASPSEQGKTVVPQILVHGEEDDIVPVSMTIDYCKSRRARGEAVSRHVLPGAGHFDLIDPTSDAWRVVARSVACLGDDVANQ